jgi:1-phosphofructokinase
MGRSLIDSKPNKTPKNTRSIVTLTMNPALDLTVRLNQLNQGQVNLANAGSLRAGGKGINVSLALSDLGQASIATGVLGNNNRVDFDALFLDHKIENAFLHQTGSTRINVKLSEVNQRITEINLPGLTCDTSITDQITQRVMDQADRAELFVLAGSLPSSVNSCFYGELITRLKAKGKKVIVDTSGEALVEAIKAGPYLIKPNMEEFTQLTGRQGIDGHSIEQKLDSIRGLGVKHIVVSDGAKGATWYCPNQTWRAIPPALSTIVSTVGAGDSLVAGLAFGLNNQFAVAQSLSIASAMAAMAVTQIGVGITEPQRFDQFLQEVSVNQID